MPHDPKSLPSPEGPRDEFRQVALKPCPFCGGQHVTSDRGVVECGKCHAGFYCGPDEGGTEAAAKAWNCRAAHVAGQEPVAWTWEESVQVRPDEGDGRGPMLLWQSRFSQKKPEAAAKVRNIRPLFASPLATPPPSLAGPGEAEIAAACHERYRDGWTSVEAETMRRTLRAAAQARTAQTGDQA